MDSQQQVIWLQFEMVSAMYWYKCITSKKINHKVTYTLCFAAVYKM